MSRYLRQSTAFTFRIGPFVDSTDGVTAETGLTIAQADIQISKDGGAFAQTSDASPTTTHDTDGWYQCPLTATDTNTLGPLTVQIVASGALPVWEHFMVVPANVYDSIVDGSDNLDVNAAQVGAQTASATATVDFDDLATILTDTNELQSDDVPGLISALNDLSAAEVNAEVDTALSDYDAVVPADLPTNFADLSITATTGRVDIASIEGTDATDQIRDAVVDDATRFSGADIAAILTDTGSLNDTKIPDTISLANINAEADTALSDYDPPTRAELTSDINSLNDPTAADVADAVWDEAQSGHTTAGTFGEIATEIASILADTGELQTDDVPGLIAGLNDFDPANDTVATVTDVVNQVTADVTAISGDSTAADRLEAMMDGLIVAQINDASATTTAFAADGFTEATDDHLNGRLITFISGALSGQQTDITDYDAAGGTQGSQEITCTALTEAPADGDFFVIH